MELKTPVTGYSYTLLCSPGRAGSTMTMQLLCPHPEILARELFPYETRFRQYLEVAKLNGRDAPTFGPETVKGATFTPYSEADGMATAWRRAAQIGPFVPSAISDSFYRHVAQSQQKASPRIVLEKTIGSFVAQKLLEADRGAKALFLFRDPRDTYFSIKAYNRKINSPVGFGEELGDDAMFRGILGTPRRHAILSDLFGDRVAWCRYEDLSRRKSEALEAVLAWLGVDSRPDRVSSLYDGLTWSEHSSRHSTAGSVDDSIGRWRLEAADHDLKIFKPYLGELRKIGYEA